MLRLAGILLLGTTFCWAQRAQVEQARQLRTPHENAVPAEERAGTVRVQTETSDFGKQVLLREAKTEPSHFFVQLELPGYFTSNVALRKFDEKTDFFFVPTLSAGYRQRLSPTLSFDVRLQTSEFRYKRFTELDFLTLEGRARLRYRPVGWERVSFYAAYTYSEFFDTDGPDSFFRSHAAQVGVEAVLASWKSTALEGGLSAQLNWADPRTEERDEYRAYLLYSWNATSRLRLELSYQYGFYDYAEPDGRTDQNHGVWLGASYHLNDHFDLSASAFAAWNRSSKSIFDYDLFNPGVSLNVSVTF